MFGNFEKITEVFDKLSKPLEFLEKRVSNITKKFESMGDGLLEKMGFEMDKVSEETTEKLDELEDEVKVKEIKEKLKSLSEKDIFKYLYESIIIQESGGDYTEINEDSGAIGIGQVIPKNIPAWTKEALKKEMSVEEFKKDKKAQIKTVKYWLEKFYTKEIKETDGNILLAIKRVAATWYSGHPDKYENTTAQGGGKYPTIKEYADNISERFIKKTPYKEEYFA